MGRKKKVRQRYFLPSNEGPIEVTEEIYYAYYGSRDQERVLNKFYLRRCYSIDEIKDNHSQINAEVQAILYKHQIKNKLCIPCFINIWSSLLWRFNCLYKKLIIF